MATSKEIIRNLNLMSNCESVEELESTLKSYVERSLGHVVADLAEADEWLSKIMPSCEDETRYGDYQSAEFELDNESARVHVKIEEVMKDSGADDYCYIVTVEEV